MDEAKKIAPERISKKQKETVQNETITDAE
jgi:hypothetical protein